MRLLILAAAFAATALAGHPLCTTPVSGPVPKVTYKVKMCTKICGDETLVCGINWVCLNTSVLGVVIADGKM
jgi:hypothetical protein